MDGERASCAKIRTAMQSRLLAFSDQLLLEVRKAVDFEALRNGGKYDRKAKSRFAETGSTHDGLFDLFWALTVPTLAQLPVKVESPALQRSRITEFSTSIDQTDSQDKRCLQERTSNVARGPFRVKG